MVVIQSTISGNGGTGSFDGGGLYQEGGTSELSFVTIASNSVGGVGGGIRLRIGTLYIKNSIVGNNQPTDCFSTDSFNSQGKNFATDNTCSGFTQVPSTGSGGLNLGPLGYYGNVTNLGLTPTPDLVVGSAAIDAVTDCTFLGPPPNTPTTDQRIIPMPQGSRCVSGSFEFQASDMAANSFTPPLALSPGSGQNISFSCANVANTNTVNATCTLAATAGPVASPSCTPSSGTAAWLPRSANLSCTANHTAPGSPGGSNTPDTDVTFTVTAGAVNGTNASNDTSSSAPVPIVDAIDDAANLFGGGMGAYPVDANDQVRSGSPPTGSTFTYLGGSCYSASVHATSGVASFLKPVGSCTVQYELCFSENCDVATLSVTGTAIHEIPTLSGLGLVVLVLLLATYGFSLVRRSNV